MKKSEKSEASQLKSINRRKYRSALQPRCKFFSDVQIGSITDLIPEKKIGSCLLPCEFLQDHLDHLDLVYRYRKCVDNNKVNMK